jgi:predicted enzyme related to lactoylglutathione lyase
MKHNPVGWFEIYVQDMDRARAFYQSVLGVTLEPLEAGDIEMFAFPMDASASGTGGSLIRVPGVASGGTGTMVYFNCEDCGVEEGRVVDAGGSVERPKMSIGEYGFVSVIKDPDGNLFGLHSLS